VFRSGPAASGVRNFKFRGRVIPRPQVLDPRTVRK